MLANSILIFEWLAGGGLWHDDELPDLNCNMQQQGWAMLRAVAEDFAALGYCPVLPIDSRLLDHWQVWARDVTEVRFIPIDSAARLPAALHDLAGNCCRTMVIAPEIGGCLSTTLAWLREHQDRLISPDANFVMLTSCKQATLDCLSQNGFQKIPAGEVVSELTEDSLAELRKQLASAKSAPRLLKLHEPCVVKPLLGAGSEGVCLVRDWRQFDFARVANNGPFRIEQFVGGVPVSVSVIATQANNELLTPTRQRFDREPFGHYIAAETLEKRLAARAASLASEAVAALPTTRGYFGIDLILSDRGLSFDRLIEVNPRLTMSYLKLREVDERNLASLMLAQQTSIVD